eukprot:TRINITY_DN5216_c0_g2_i1.p1 TRINITY_DN5216_c0_g2~~TRINITY_DN5216_c0_g2_i1.p1  ORF type:complete len:1322 (+),score=217.62 TRINITY_DN5216_c0_g2_i1:131-4096(+)
MTSTALMHVSGVFLACLTARASLSTAAVSSQKQHSKEAPPAFEEDLASPISSPKALLRAESKASLSLIASDGTKLHAAVDTAGNVDSLELAQTEQVTQQTPLGDVDCIWEEWADWSVCQFTCGGGESMRTRKVRTMAQGNGAACDNNMKETRQCAKNDCPVDCLWDEWSDWSSCSMSCGTGTKTMTRKFKQVAAFGGLTCQGLTTASSECTLGDCPVDCKYGDWESWSGCSVSCAGGIRKRFRPVAVTPNAVGKQCEAVGKNVEEAACGQNNCPIDCKLEDWTSWDLCDVSCGQGSSQRTRAIKTVASFGGQPCGVMFQNKTCDNGVCPADCKLSDWTEWHACDVTCGAGKRARSRVIAEKGNSLGAKCPTDEASRTQIESCNMNGCPVDCKMSDWSEWTGCSVTCGSGINERYRENQVHAEYGGRPCHHNTTYEKKYCSLEACPVDCDWDDWQDWRGCSTSCGNGTGLRMRIVKTPELHGGKVCSGGFSQNRDCNLRYCPLHCQWSDWSNWTSCSNTCGEGSQARSRQVAVEADYGGLPCSGNTQQSRRCEDVSCPIHCAWTDWGVWSSCSSSCGTGQHSRTRSIGTEAAHGGVQCPGSAAETKDCENLPKCPVDCEWDNWSDWQACSKTCGEALSKRTRIRKRYEKDGGHVCFGTEDDEQACNLDPCPIDCVLGDWSPWGGCTATCGNDGKHLRTRGIKTQAQHSGKDCDAPRNSSKSCELGPCPVDCVWADWEPWAACSKSCAGGVTSRKRLVKVANEFNGLPCHGASREDAACNVEGCIQDCVWDVWSDWSECSKTCNGGVRTQTRKIKTPAAWGGKACEPSDEKSESCNEQNCPVDCCWSSWTPFSLCSKSCEGGMMSRTRVKAPAESDGGIPCVGAPEESNFCNTQGCPRDCQWTAWSQWTDCSKKCGGGKIKRFRDISVASKNGGEKCAGLFEQEADCNVEDCAQDCEWGEWSEWSACPVTCDGGIRTKTRSKKREELHGGQPCDGNTTQKESCGLTQCPVDCEWKPWGDWGPCSASCGGERIRKRIKAMEMYGGKPCVGEMGEKGSCDTAGAQGCPVTTSTTTTTTTTTTKKPIKPCDNGRSKDTTSDNKTKQIEEEITKLTPIADRGNTTSSNTNSSPGDDAAKVLESIMNATKKLMPTPDEGGTKMTNEQTPPAASNSTAGSDLPDADKSNVVAEVGGDLSLSVDDADRFISGFNTTRAMTHVIASIAQVRPQVVKVYMSLIQSVLLATWRRRATGNVNVAYMIEVTMGSGKNATDVAASMSKTDISSVNDMVQQSLASYGISMSVRAASLSVTVLPVENSADMNDFKVAA